MKTETTKKPSLSPSPLSKIHPQVGFFPKQRELQQCREAYW